MGGYQQLPVTPFHPQQSDPLEQYGNLLRLKGMQQGQQLQQQQLANEQQQNQSGALDLQEKRRQAKDQEAMTTAMQQWDGKDMNALVPLVVKNGGSATAVVGLKSKILEQQAKYSEMAKNDAEAGSNNIATLLKKNDMVSGALGAVMQSPDGELGQRLIQATNDLAQKGLIDPEHAQMAQQLSQLDPASLRQQLDMFRKGYMSESQQAEEALKTAQTRSANANSSREESQAAWATAHGMPVGVPASDVQMADWLAKNPGKGPSDYEIAMKKVVPAYNFNLQNAGATGQNGQPSAMAQAVAKGDMKWGDVISARTPFAVKEAFAKEVKQLNPDFNSGDFEVEKKVREKYTSGNVSDQLLAINTAREHMKTFGKLAEALDTGDVQLANKIGQAFGVQFGSDKKTNFDIAAQAFGGEVGKAFDGAGVTAGERKQAEESYTSAMSKGQFKGAISTVDELLAGKQRSAKQSYEAGKEGKPNFGGGTTHAPGKQAGLPEGQTGTGSDGKKYVVKGGVWTPQ